MSSLIIGLLVFGAVFVPLLLLIMNMIEKARIEKERKITNLTYSYLSLNGISNGIPKAYSIPSLTVDVVRESIKVLLQLANLKPRDRSVSKTLRIQKERLEQLSSAQIETTLDGPVESLAEVRKVQHYQTKLANFIQIRQRKGAYTQDQANQYMKQLQWLAIKCVTDMYIAKSEVMAENKNYQLAVFNLKKAIVEYGKLPADDDCRNALALCREKLAQRERELAAYNAERQSELEEETRQVRQQQDKAWALALDGGEPKKKYY